MKGEYLQYFGGLLLVVGIIVSVPIAIDSESILTGVYTAMWSTIGGMFFIGFGELLRSILRIEHRIAGPRPHFDPLTGQYVDTPHDKH
ncbi:hypothetical protein [Paenibacillus sp. P46E]|uniref:hypothetical protein n=1 Tax=Paenibacillus sp. P46E TaxID=1349436 RepID=UPI00094023DF|nr:hypothetical protein [Paenibacillus sp. P46E]OKP96498.1 hypothetical protein A3849_20620 [Paenibacillus sp. P46E]